MEVKKAQQEDRGVGLMPGAHDVRKWGKVTRHWWAMGNSRLPMGTMTLWAGVSTGWLGC